MRKKDSMHRENFHYNKFGIWKLFHVIELHYLLLTNDRNNVSFPNVILILCIHTTFSKVKFMKSSHTLSLASLSCYKLQNSHHQLTHGAGTLRFRWKICSKFPLLNNHQGHLHTICCAWKTSTHGVSFSVYLRLQITALRKRSLVLWAAEHCTPEGTENGPWFSQETYWEPWLNFTRLFT